jgi:hypothetical protein
LEVRALRRSQTDWWSSPVRNLFPTPGSEISNGTATVRTNFCTNPGIEAVGGTAVTIRTNLALNPRMTNFNFGGYGSQTLTAVSGIPAGQPDGITTGVRVSYTNGASNPGVIVMQIPDVSTQYTVSAWVYLEGTVSDTIAIALKGSSSGGTQTLAPGVWTRLSWTMTTPASLGSGNDFGVRIAGAGETASFVVTGVLIEKSPVLDTYFDGTSIRQNLISNSNFAVNTTGWSFAGTAPVRVDTSIFGKPALQLTRAASAVAIAISTPRFAVTPGQKLSYSALGSVATGTAMAIDLEYYNSSGNFMSGAPRQYLATSAAASTTVTAADTPTRWGIAGAVVPAGAVTAQLRIYRDSGVDGITYATDVLLEIGDTLNPYYEGTGGLTFSWTGTANASTSLQRGISCPSFLGANQAVVYRIGAVGSLSARTFFTNNTFQDSGFALLTSVSTLSPNKTYTLSCDITTDRNRALRLSIQGAGATSTSAPFTHVAGVKVRRSITFQTNGVTAVNNVAPYVLRNDLLMGSIDVDNILIEEGSVAQPYFDGSTPASGDFTYSWLTTANASISRQISTVVSGFLGTSSTSLVMVQSNDWNASGTKSVRIVPITSSTDTCVNCAPGFNLPVGTYTILATLRITTPQTGTIDSRARRIVAYHSGQQAMGPQSPNVAGIYQHRLTFKNLDQAAYQSFRLYNGASQGNGDVWWDNIMIVEGDYQGDYIDGTMPFSKWTGTVNNSVSVGYPAQLFDIAGKPSLDQIGAGTTTSTTVDGFAARTLYAVYEVTDINGGSWQVPFYYGQAPSNNAFTLQTNAAGSVNISPRADFQAGGGGANISQQYVNARTIGRVHIAAFTFPQGLETMVGSVNGSADVPKVLTPGTVGWTTHKLTVNTGGMPGMKGIRGMAYLGEHDRATRLAIMRYLGNKYGAAVA